MRRRQFLTGLSAASLAGCSASVSLQTGSRPYWADFPPVLSRIDRVTRTVVGLRPYRPQGYRLDWETLGEKTVVHSYGHGGCGVTMSWGTAVVAADYASEAGHEDVAVLGCGVQGLTAALTLARRGHNVTIYAADLPPYTTSNIAGVLWMPTTYFDRRVATPEFLAWDRELIRKAWLGFIPYVNRPGYGVYWADHHSLGMQQRRDWTEGLPGGDDIYPELTRTTEGNLFGYAYQQRSKAMIIDPDYYLDAILQDAQLAGARIVQREFADLSEVMALPEQTIVNCTGLGAGVLFGDEDIFPVRGQLTHLLPQEEIKYSYVAPTDNGVLYMFPRKTGIVLGGTSDYREWDRTPNPAEITRMVEGHAELAGRLRI
ncbi:FAD-dependent oxidoreductase [Ponticaulis koreensis]|uniref:FAD-dependent oxidoreductase n=1 Tax=Ponticaulis koreensis TaxID=1123045 RepID=UPI0003B54A2D|nr:FAD-dependent oxidoreductase [Ponticaulis koreensis]